METDACCICGQIAGYAASDLISRAIRDQVYVRRVPLENESFAVIPSVGPLTPGHSLLCPKWHIRSIAQLPLAVREVFSEIKLQLRSMLCDVFAAPVHCFEHGSAVGSPKTLCTTDHAHLHFVPCGVNVLEVLLAQEEWIQIPCGFRELSEAVGDSEYLYYETPTGQAFVAKAGSNGFQSQYLRRIFATALGRSDGWDWRKDLKIEEVDRTFRALSAAVR